MNFEPVIGLEIHVEMKTKSKMFSSSPVLFGQLPNTMTTPLDLGFPGTMPVVNKQAVINAIRVCHALHLHIDQEIFFDRKNYFYSDLPKGYQITQQRRPIGSNGYLDIYVNGQIKRVEIERLHMEEDTCKQLHFGSYTLLDYNRAGTPLIEIVTRPTIRSGEEAMKFVEMIRQIVLYADVSNGKMEEGSLRCDTNVSVRPIGSTKFGTKVEVKNLNSIANIQKAIDYEAKRQSELILANIPVTQETRRFDEATKETVLMRLKTDAVDYKYFTEPNITPIKLSDEFVENAIRTCPELANVKKDRYIKEYGISETDADILISDRGVAFYFDECAKIYHNYNVLKNWILGDVLSFINKNFMSIDEFPISPKELANLIRLIDSGEISNKQAREIFELMCSSSCTVQEGKEKLGITSQISDEKMIIDLVRNVLDNNAQSIVDYKAGKDRALGFLVGQVMKLSHGKVNPGLTNKILKEELDKR
jgi:aspartyl-tRNA(Asn)/glutamyl-tRNA(Gln) amidotransferase subunit B